MLLITAAKDDELSGSQRTSGETSWPVDSQLFQKLARFAKYPYLLPDIAADHLRGVH